MKTFILNSNEANNCVELIDFDDVSRTVLDECALVDNPNGIFEFAILAFDLDVDDCDIIESHNGVYSALSNLTSKLTGYNF